jgi:uncharacterized protein YutE (UPF0331/DUF86 family)
MTFAEIGERLRALRSNLEKLERIPQSSYEEFVGDFRNVGSAIYYMQTSIQALIDIASWLLARLALGAPRRSIDAFEMLESAGHLPEGTAQRMAPIVGFRNRVVHLYDRVDEAIVYEILTQHIADLPQVLDHLLAIAGDEH